MKKLTENQRLLLLEALRRYSRFHANEPLTAAWTGLGSYTTYRSVIDSGLMTYVRRPHPGYTQWFWLTDKGAAYVQEWLDQGIDYKVIESSFEVVTSLEPTAPIRCRVCFSRDLNAKHFEADNAAAHRIVECGDCGHKWMEIYRFDTVEPVD